jgi:hypothetical protein
MLLTTLKQTILNIALLRYVQMTVVTVDCIVCLPLNFLIAHHQHSNKINIALLTQSVAAVIVVREVVVSCSLLVIHLHMDHTVCVKSTYSNAIRNAETCLRYNCFTYHS